MKANSPSWQTLKVIVQNVESNESVSLKRAKARLIEVNADAVNDVEYVDVVFTGASGELVLKAIEMVEKYRPQTETRDLYDQYPLGIRGKFERSEQSPSSFFLTNIESIQISGLVVWPEDLPIRSREVCSRLKRIAAGEELKAARWDDPFNVHWRSGLTSIVAQESEDLWQVMEILFSVPLLDSFVRNDRYAETISESLTRMTSIVSRDERLTAVGRDRLIAGITSEMNSLETSYLEGLVPRDYVLREIARCWTKGWLTARAMPAAWKPGFRPDVGSGKETYALQRWKAEQHKDLNTIGEDVTNRSQGAPDDLFKNEFTHDDLYLQKALDAINDLARRRVDVDDGNEVLASAITNAAALGIAEQEVRQEIARRLRLFEGSVREI